MGFWSAFGHGDWGSDRGTGDSQVPVNTWVASFSTGLPSTVETLSPAFNPGLQPKCLTMEISDCRNRSGRNVGRKYLGHFPCPLPPFIHCKWDIYMQYMKSWVISTWLYLVFLPRQIPTIDHRRISLTTCMEYRSLSQSSCDETVSGRH